MVTMTQTSFKNELKEMVISCLNLEDVAAHDIQDDAPLFGDDGLGLDSVDALTLVVQIERDYGVEIEDEEVGRQAFASISALADFIESKKN
ncbi:acyl carrier protein [Oceanidesulfovibrio indonesiensis]|uniref:Acyl carrier protein n=1 Tax=Oceanidesulfovibrio indonesiensis TaxID=54767 RepID=A0A7M3MIL8_9BACT|nr:phosphopantetheine-binding protein [Oceanidesulfovibrio indonesiensis]TVM19225.1 acyl carrier protein [Oceanidesulfovibrio indonesiensis]